MGEKLVRTVTASLLAGWLGVLPLAAQESPKERNQVLLDLSLEQGVDDNPDGSGDSSYLLEFSPHLRFRQNRPRGYWELGYQPTFRHFSSFSSQDRFDHRVRFETDLRLSPRWSLDFHQQVVHSSNPFLLVAEDPGRAPTPRSALFGPSRSFVGPERRFAHLTSELSFHYALGPYTRVNFGGDYYREDHPNQFLLDQDTRNLRLDFEKQFAKSHTLSALYSFQLFRVSASNTRVRTHSLLLTHAYEFRPGTRLTLFAGPQYSRVRAEPTATLDFLLFRLTLAIAVREEVTHTALGVLFSHRVTDRTELDLGVSQRVSEGGGFLGTALQRSARMGLSRQLSRRLAASLSGYLSDNRSLAGLGFTSRFHTWGVSPGIDFALSRRLGLTARYDFSRVGSVPEALRNSLGRNRFIVGLHYSWGPYSVGR